MSKPGPSPKPTALKKLAGNPGHRPLPKNEPQPQRGERAPSCPRWLPEDAKPIWKEHARQLWQLRLLTEIDVDAYAAYCETMALYRLASGMVRLPQGAARANGAGTLKATPWVAIRRETLDQLRRLWGDFGMTPSARSRIEIPGEEETKDPFEQFLVSETIAKREPPAEKPLRKTG